MPTPTSRLHWLQQRIAELVVFVAMVGGIVLAGRVVLPAVFGG